MIDIHSHTLPFTDDGASDWEEALTMLRQAEQDGIQVIVLTPHISNELDFKNEREIIGRYVQLKKKARVQGLTIEIMLGSEILIQPNLALHHRIATLNNNGIYFLTEFPMQTIPRYAKKVFYKLIVDGYIPIIAHPERNERFLKKTQLVHDFVEIGVLMQINSGSIEGRFGQNVKSLAFNLIENNLAHFIASDGHKCEIRKCQLKKAWNLVAKEWGESKARRLFIENPQKAIRGEKGITSA